MARKAVADFGDALRFMSSLINTADQDQTRKLRRLHAHKFYGWMVRNAEQVGLVFACPHCKLVEGVCNCPQMGKPGRRPGEWEYHYNAIHNWRLDTASLRRAACNKTSGSPNAHLTFQAFVSFLRRR